MHEIPEREPELTGSIISYARGKVQWLQSFNAEVPNRERPQSAGDTPGSSSLSIYISVFEGLGKRFGSGAAMRRRSAQRRQFVRFDVLPLALGQADGQPGLSEPVFDRTKCGAKQIASASARMMSSKFVN